MIAFSFLRILRFHGLQQIYKIYSKNQMLLISYSTLLYLFMILKEYSAIKGLKYFDNFLNRAEKDQVLSVINSNKWCDRLLRRQQYYGIKYFQTKLNDHILQPKQSSQHYPLQPFQFIIDRMIYQYNLFSEQNPPNQILVNRYYHYNKLGLHVEDKQAFGQIIAGVSLGTADYLRLADVSDNNRQFLLELKDCSCYVLSGQARMNWRHGIGRVMDNKKYKTEDFQRISLTVRHVIDSRRKIELQ